MAPVARGRSSPASAPPEREAVCFSAPVVEVLREVDLRRHAVLTALGPDLCVPGADLDEVLARLDALDPATPIGVALLDQTVAAGIGNVYRAEVAWACRRRPLPARARASTPRPDASCTPPRARLLRANLDSPRRTTVPGGLAVYDRAGRACPRCGGTVVTRRLGEQARSVWWCPGCQR